MKRQFSDYGIVIVSLLVSAGLAASAQSGANTKTKPAAAASSDPKANTASRPKEHPVPLQADAKASLCVECHSGVQSGKYVHAAMSMGCTTCHAINTKDGVTRVTLVSPEKQLCESCHALSTDKVLHGPYHDGLCVTCHSPHSSDFPAHTWVSAQNTCLGCHARARLKVNQKAKTMTTPWGKTLTFAQMKGGQFLNLNSMLTRNHPVAGHPVSGPNRKPNLAAITCLSCHKSHASPYKNLLTAGAPKDMKLCATCGVCEHCHESMY